jgi:hypothetical protein
VLLQKGIAKAIEAFIARRERSNVTITKPDGTKVHIPSKTYLPLAFAPSGTLLASAYADDLSAIQILRINT